MASPTYYNFPPFRPSLPPLPPPAARPPPPPPPYVRPPAPPPPQVRPPPPSPSPPPPPIRPLPPSLSPPPPYVRPPPPSLSPPPPYVRPPPPSLSPPPSPSGHTTVIVIVFVSFGGVLFLACLAAALFCFLKKRKKKSVQEAEMLHVDEHLKMKEAIVNGPHGPEVVGLVIEDDVHIEGTIKKNEELEKGLHKRSSEDKSSDQLQAGAASSSSSCSIRHHQLDHKV